MMMDLNENELRLLEKALSDRRYGISEDIKIFDSKEEDGFTETISTLKAQYEENEKLRSKILKSLYEME